MIKVYIAGPISKGDQAANVKMGLNAAHQLADAGFFPYVPQLTWFWHMVHPRDHASWMRLDRPWFDCCDVVLRLPGESKGADMEVQWAKEAGKPGFYSLDSLFRELLWWKYLL